jgi:hypothetical protein
MDKQRIQKLANIPSTINEEINERLSNSEFKRMDGLHSYKQMDDALKMLMGIGSELSDEGFDKQEIIEFILRKVERRLFTKL